jgi:hypothetical protein
MSLHKSFSEWLRVPRDFETIGRSLQRKVLGLDKRTSFPFISGDTFKYMCDEVLEGLIHEEDCDLYGLQGLRGRLFVQAEPMSNATRLLVDACKTGLRFPFADLVIHNGDVIPNFEEMKLLSGAFNKVYSVNWLGGSAIATPLPIGLENRDKRRNGVPVDYLREIVRGLPDRENREISLLVAFSVHTNFTARSAALKHSQGVPGVKILTNPITPKQYRKLVLRSQYVLSPPGNGPDCHRTWEALYLGATPIVHLDCWPFLEKNVPVITVDSWNEISEKIKTGPVSDGDSWKEISFWLPS